jgi:hypothetical protein
LGGRISDHTNVRKATPKSTVSTPVGGGHRNVQLFNAQTTEQREGGAVSVMPEPNLEIDCSTQAKSSTRKP